jgi:hypothetical protein
VYVSEQAGEGSELEPVGGRYEFGRVEDPDSLKALAVSD